MTWNGDDPDTHTAVGSRQMAVKYPPTYRQWEWDHRRHRGIKALNSFGFTTSVIGSFGQAWITTKSLGNYWTHRLRLALSSKCLMGSQCSRTIVLHLCNRTVLQGHSLNVCLLSWHYIFLHRRNAPLCHRHNGKISQALLIFMWHWSDLLWFPYLLFKKFI